jgi:hypothetical protein
VASGLQAQEQQRALSHGFHQQGDQVERETVGPVQVFEGQNHGASARKGDEEIPHRQECLVPELLGGIALKQFLLFMIRAQREQPAQQRGDPLATFLREIRAGGHLGQRGADAAAPVLVGLLGPKAEVGLEHVDEWRIAGQCVHLQATSLEPGEPFFAASRGRQRSQLSDQARLANPCLADERDHLAAPLANFGQGRRKARQLRLPADQLSRETLSPRLSPAPRQWMLDAIFLQGAQVSIRAR